MISRHINFKKCITNSRCIYTVTSVLLQKVLVRDYIKKRQDFTPIVSMQEEVQWASLWTAGQYRKKLEQLQDKYKYISSSAIFNPYYGRSLASYMLTKLQRSEPLRVLEVEGAGGINALSVLDFLKQNSPHIYKDMSYVVAVVC